jgi:hypothetical protein
LADKVSQDGYQLPAHGTIRIFMVFSEVINDPNELGALEDWGIGEMPTNKAIATVNYMEQYFSEASFGQYQVEVDFYPELIQITNTERTNGNYGVSHIMSRLNQLHQQSPIGLQTYKGIAFPDSFDVQLDGQIDFFAVFFRNNRSLTPTANERNGGKTSYGGLPTIIAAKQGCNVYSAMSCSPSSMGFLLRHEFVHTLFGGNEFHSGIHGASRPGTSNYIHNFSGYGLLSSQNTINDFCNAWDRRRLGWKHPSKQSYISALPAGGTSELNTDMVYNPTYTGTSLFRLRDFREYGDAVRIKLPYIPEAEGVDPQWIWIENHQITDSTVNYEYKSYYHKGKPIPRGMYVNYQIANESFSSFASRTNYYTTEHSFGHYDLSSVSFAPADQGKKCTAHIADSLANPFTGYNFLSYIALDGNGNNQIDNSEEYLVQNTYLNSALIPASDCHFQGYLALGSKYDAFIQGQVLSMTTNPAPVPRLTHQRDNSGTTILSATIKDNRKIYLNGLSITMAQQFANGDIIVAVRFNDFDVKNDVRWCGDIVLTEKVNVKPSNTLLLDQGLSATRPNNPITFQGKKVFADPTICTCRNNSQLNLESGSRLINKNNSTLVVESGATFRITDAKAIVESGACIRVRAGGTLEVKGKGILLIRQGGFIEIENDANIILQDEESYLVLEDSSCLRVPNSNPNYQSSIANISKTGQGTIPEYFNTLYLQNTNQSSNRTLYVKEAKIGRSVTTTKPSGVYKIASGSKVTITAEEPVIIQDGFEVSKDQGTLQGTKFRIDISK